MGIWAGSGSGGKTYGAMSRVRERWGDIRGDGQDPALVWRHTGPWAGSASGGETYGAMGMVRERWGGMRGHGHAKGDVGRHTIYNIYLDLQDDCALTCRTLMNILNHL